MDASGLIAQRMLQGWTMLADSCENCKTVPLVKLKNVTECVSCASSLPSLAKSPEKDSKTNMNKVESSLPLAPAEDWKNDFELRLSKRFVASLAFPKRSQNNNGTHMCDFVKVKETMENLSIQGSTFKKQILEAIPEILLKNTSDFEIMAELSKIYKLTQEINLK